MSLDKDPSLSVFIVSHDQKIIKDADSKNIPNLKYIFVGNGPFDLILDMDNVIIARNYPDNLESQKYLLSFTAWYLIVKNNLCLTSHLIILEYDSVLKDNFYNKTLEKIKQGYEALSYERCPAPVKEMIFLASPMKILNSQLIKLANLEDFMNLTPWFHTTNQCMSLSLLKDFVNWFYELQFRIQEYDFLHLSWYHERLYSMYLAKNKIKHDYLKGIVVHEFSESHTLSGANSLTYFKWELYLELHKDVKKVYGYNSRGALNHFIDYGQKEKRSLRIPDFNWEIYSHLYPSGDNELAASLHYLNNSKNIKYPTNFDWKAHSTKHLINKDDIILHYLKIGQYEIPQNYIILLSATIDVKDCCYVYRKNIPDRINDYKKALNFYLNETPFKIVFVENSGYDLFFLPDHERLEKISFNGNDLAKDLGKGYGERHSVNHAVENSKFISQSSHIVKITGRLIISNIKEIISHYDKSNILYGPFNIAANKDKDLVPNHILGENQVNSQIYIFDKNCVNNINRHPINDSKGFYMEHAIYNIIDHSYNLLRPIIKGISATINKSY